MIPQSFNLFFLRELPFTNFAFPRWHAVLAITVIGGLVGLDPSLRSNAPGMLGMPLFASIPIAALSVWAAFLIITGILKWWLKRDGRWDGSGNLLNLVAASWLVADTLSAGLIALGIPAILTLPLWLYSIWVGANALSGAIPKASLGYAIAGIVISLLPAMFISSLIIGFAGFALAGMGQGPGAVPR